MDELTDEQLAIAMYVVALGDIVRDGEPVDPDVLSQWGRSKWGGLHTAVRVRWTERARLVRAELARGV